MGRVFKILFYTYVILLAGWVTYKNLMLRSYGKTKVPFQQSTQQCYQGGPDWKFCTHTYANTDPSAYLYVLHGRGGDENFWQEGVGYSGLLQQYLQNSQRKIPMPITISFGDTWIVTRRMTRPDTGLMERFEKEVFRVIEEKLGRPKYRLLIGNSMGALNALTISLEMRDKFLRVIALCPPLFQLSPYDHWHKVMEFARRTGAEPRSIMTIIGMGRNLFSNTDEWLLFNPIEKVKGVQFKTRPQYYISAGTRDEYGIFEGAFLFVQRLRKTSAMIYWRPNSGGHCSVDIQSVGKFLEL